VPDLTAPSGLHALALVGRGGWKSRPR